jgi:hypothetical protein
MFEELTQCLTLSQFAQTFLTNPSKLRIHTHAKVFTSEVFHDL